MNDICKKVVKTIKTLRNDHDTILGVDNYDWFQAYIEGYVDGLNISSNTDLRIDITNVYNPGENHVYWTDQIKYKNQNQENGEKVSILLDTTEKYFSDHSSWFTETDSNELKNKIFFRLNGLKNRRGMFFSEHLPLNIYLEGFVNGLCVYINNNFRQDISQRFFNKTGQKKSFHWTKQICDYYTGKVNDLDTKLIEELEDFFRTNNSIWSC